VCSRQALALQTQNVKALLRTSEIWSLLTRTLLGCHHSDKVVIDIETCGNNNNNNVRVLEIAAVELLDKATMVLEY